MLMGKSAKTSPATKENPGTNTSDLSKVVKPKQTRKSSSLKCGCQWKVSFYLSKLEIGFFCKVLDVSLSHTNGCTPSREQYFIVKQRLGDKWVCGKHNHECIAIFFIMNNLFEVLMYKQSQIYCQNKHITSQSTYKSVCLALNIFCNGFR